MSTDGEPKEGDFVAAYANPSPDALPMVGTVVKRKTGQIVVELPSGHARHGILKNTPTDILIPAPKTAK